MRKMGMAVAMILLIAVPAFMQAVSSAVENEDAFVLNEGDSLSTAWRGRGEYQEMFRGSGGFLAFWRETCKLNPDIPCTDLAYRHLPVGTRLLLPPLSHQDLIVVAEAPPVQEVAVVPAAGPAFPLKWMVLGTMVTVVCGLYRRRGVKKVLAQYQEDLKGHRARIELLRSEIRRHEIVVASMGKFIKNHFHRLPAPPDLESETGREMYFLISPEQIDGELTVMVRIDVGKKGERFEKVKVTNLLSFLNKRSDEELAFHGLKRQLLTQVA